MHSGLKFFLRLSCCFATVFASTCFAQEKVDPLELGLTVKEMKATSGGCVDCHGKIDSVTMHSNPAIQVGCVDCHGGNQEIRAQGLIKGSAEYEAALKAAHIAPSNPEIFKSSANPEHSFAGLLKESVEFVKFMNPGDLRVARETCGGCHSEIVHAVERSLMTTSAMLLQGASYNNGILPYKIGVLGESYNPEGIAREIHAGRPVTADERVRGVLEKLIPLPQWEVVPPGDIFRVFERGGRLIRSQFAEVGLPNPEEESGKPDIRASNRGPGTGARISVPVLNIQKTRLNDPHLSMLGTNDHPGDYRSSGCTACHSIYANDRDARHSGPYAKHGHEGKSISKDESIPKDESGHPLQHVFSRSIPTSQCMVCHMHQPNMFVNSYLGYTMWDYESDAPHMWPEKQKYPTDEERYKSQLHNPEEAAIRGKWTDRDFLKSVSDLNSFLRDTQFADYHGHGWNFRAIFKRDRKGRLLDANGQIVSSTDPQKFKKAVHLADIHLDKGMHCVDCHFGQDSHGDGHMYGEVAQAVEIQCQDCHGTIQQLATLKTSGPAAQSGGRDLTIMRTPFGDPLFAWEVDGLYQYSFVTPGLKWRVKQVKDTVTSNNPDYNEKSARAKTLRRLEEGQQHAGFGIPPSGQIEKGKLAHSDDQMTCFACHSSWVTSCAGCHLPIEANWKKISNHYDGKETRNWATYNPQVARDEMFQLGKHGPAKNGKIAPIRSSSALVLSSTDVNRQRIYIQQPPISSPGYSSQAFAPHFPHTVRTTETKKCSDCHVSDANDNNAILAQLLLQGTNFVNFMGFHVYTAVGEGGLDAVQVTEWDEPQAVIGSYLHRYAYPDYYNKHQEHKQQLQTIHHHQAEGGAINAIQLRGEYLYTTAGPGGFRAFDVASIANKGFSERIVTAPVSPLGQDTHVASKNATSFTLPTSMPVAANRSSLPENLELPLHPIYHYAFITDSEEGLILVDIDTLSDGNPSNNFFSRALTWNENGVLTGARTITLAGAHAFIATQDRVVVLDLDDPLHPKLITSLAFSVPTSIAVQFRYAFVTDAKGLHVVDITEIGKAQEVAALPLQDARSVYLARTYAYVSGGRDGLVIVDIERPEKPREYMRYNGDGRINDLNDVKIATTNASLFAYLADGKNGLKVLQLTDPERVPEFYGFSPEVKPKIISWAATDGPAMAISKPLDRDRAVDETGHQVSIFGRLGSRPFNAQEMERFYRALNGALYTVSD